METCYFGYWWGAEERRHAAVSESDRRLIFRSGKPQCLVSQPSLLHSHATWKEVRSSIRRGALYLCAPPSLFIFFLLTHSTSFVLSPLNTPPLDSVRSLSHIFVISLRLSLVFRCFSHLLFSYFPHKLFSAPGSSFLLHLTMLWPPDIPPIHLQLRLNWAEHMCLRRSLKKKRKEKRKKNKPIVVSSDPRGFITNQTARRAFAWKPFVLDPVWRG